MSLANTSIPWLLGGFAIVAAITALQTLSAWRDVKRSPYFFMRREAQRRMQQYGLASLVVLSLTTAIALYSWTPPSDDIPRFAVIAQAKPLEADISLAELVSSPTVSSTSPSLPAQVSAASVATLVGGPVAIAEEAVAAIVREAPQLPAAYRETYDSDVALSARTLLGAISFSNEISDAYEPVAPRRIFAPGFYTVFGTFSYEGMKDGMEWAWVWLHNGDPVSGGTQIWEYGADGPGYVYFNPEDGFDAGEYALQIWVDEQLLTESALVVSSAATLR